MATTSATQLAPMPHEAPILHYRNPYANPIDTVCEAVVAGYGEAVHSLMEYVLQNGALPPMTYSQFVYDAIVARLFTYGQQMQDAYVNELVIRVLLSSYQWQMGVDGWHLAPAY